MQYRRPESSLLTWLASVVLVGTLAGLSLQAGSLMSAKPEDVGLSAERLARIHDAVQRHIDAGLLSGAVTLVARDGKIAHLEAHGLMDLESKRAMQKDAVFRLASMSKPVTAVAVMMLVEEGKVRLNDPVSRFIPEFKSSKVAVAKPGARGSGAAPAGPAAQAEGVRRRKSISCPRPVRSRFEIC